MRRIQGKAAALLAALWLLAGPAAAEEAYVLPEYGDPITLPGVEPDPVPEALAPAVAAYEAGEYSTARALFEPAAVAGEPVALYYLGLMYRFGRGRLEKNPSRGYALLKQAASAAASKLPQDGYTYRKSLYSMGYMTYYGAETRRDRKIGECLIKISAEFGYPPAQIGYSNVLKDYPGIHPSALEWTERSAAQGNLNSLKHLGFIESIHPFPEYNAKGFMLLHLAALGGHREARNLMKEAASLRDTIVSAQINEGIRLSQDWLAVPEAPPAEFKSEYSMCY